jgi:hypothetical protein
MTDRTLAILWLTAASLVLIATIVFLRNSPWIFIPAAALPPILVVLIARRPVVGRMDYRFGIVLAISALVLGATRGEIVDVDGNRMVAMIAALAALSFLSVLAVPTLRRRRRNLLIIGVAAAAYSHGTLVYANSVFDRSEPRHHPVRILQITERGLGKRRWALVTIEPWGPEAAARGAPDQPATTTVWMTLSFSNTTTKFG